MKGSTCWIGLLWIASSVQLYLADIPPPHEVFKCAQCHKANHIADCSGVAVCNKATEVCYVEEETDIGGETVVNAGCRLKEHCDGIGCFNEVGGTRERRDVLQRLQRRDVTELTTPDFLTRDITCHHCCDGEFCNMYGCPDKYDVTHLPGQRCFYCNHVSHPHHCTNAINCEPDHTCFYEMLQFNGDTEYNVGCHSNQMCKILETIHGQGRKKREIQVESSDRSLQDLLHRRKRSYHPVYAECCHHHMCNGHLPLLKAPPSMHSDKYRCPIFGVNNTWISTSPPTTTTTTEPTTTTLPPEPTCEDLEDCAVYGYDYACTGNFDSWAKVNCRKFCGYCTAATTTPVVTPTCEDLEDCSVYGHDYACSSQYEEWARTTCPKFCGYCTAPPTNTTCEDLEDCSLYGKDVACSAEYKAWAKITCPKFCGYCGQDNKPVMMRRAAHDTAYSVRNASPTAMKTPVPAMVVFTTMLVMFGVV
ncbi:uncharacterized protein LOC128223643 [Mya arenaria]|uniref:uncharacterized protein LOC128223643 n=1 Tax=Mya arenaria TaxID=6604 RepID=UPI0022E46D9A|nr:uncharacterized protein LOC128223643 [Mya arenaria]